jgi:hypothetical protein
MLASKAHVFNGVLSHISSDDRASNVEMLPLGHQYAGSRLQLTRRELLPQVQDTHRQDDLAVPKRPENRYSSFVCFMVDTYQTNTVPILIVARDMSTVSNKHIATFCDVSTH